MGAAPVLTNTCWVQVHSGSQFYLHDNAGALGTASYLGETWASSPENGQCVVDGPGSSRVVVGGVTNFNINLKFKVAKQWRILMRADVSGEGPWVEVGVFNVQ